VERRAGAELACDLLAEALVAACDEDAQALAREVPRDGLTDAAGCSGHEGHTLGGRGHSLIFAIDGALAMPMTLLRACYGRA
jgi:hypothetical protein